MTALVLSLARALPAPVKAKLRGNGRHRRAGKPLFVNVRLTAGRHRSRTAWDQINDLDPWLRYEIERQDH